MRSATSITRCAREVRDADLRQLATTLTRDLVYPLFALNGKSFQGPPLPAPGV